MVITAIIPTFNHARYLGSAIESVLKQSVGVNEIIIVDDGSTDETVRVVESFSAQVRYIYQPNAGLSAARNTGIAAASGDWVAFLDADDCWLPRKIEFQRLALEKAPEAVLCYGTAILHDEATGQETSVQATNPDRLWRDIRFRNCVTGSGSAVLVKKSAVLQEGGFHQSLTACEDWDLWIRLARRYKFAAVSEPIVLLRVRKSSMSSTTDRMLCNVERVIKRSLVSDLYGLRRAIWVRRIRSWALYSHSWTEPDERRRKDMVQQSLRQWPSPLFRPLRYLTFLRDLNVIPAAWDKRSRTKATTSI